MKEIERQIVQLRQELIHEPDNPELLNELGVGYHLSGLYEEAVRAFRKALEHNPQEAYKVHFNLAGSYFELQQVELAIHHYLDAVEHKPDHIPSLNNLADLYELGGKPEEAGRLFQYVTELSPEDPLGHFNLGNHHLRNNRSLEAGRCYQKVLELDPEFYEAWYTIGLILKHVNQHEEAIYYYSRCLELKPDYEPARQDLEACRRAIAQNKASG